MNYNKPTITLADALHAIQSDQIKDDLVRDNYPVTPATFATTSAYEADE